MCARLLTQNSFFSLSLSPHPSSGTSIFADILQGFLFNRKMESSILLLLALFPEKERCVYVVCLSVALIPSGEEKVAGS